MFFFQNQYDQYVVQKYLNSLSQQQQVLYGCSIRINIENVDNTTWTVSCLFIYLFIYLFF